LSTRRVHKKNAKYIKKLDKRLSATQQQSIKSKKLTFIREREHQGRVQDRPKLSEGTHKLTQDFDVKNVFERQRVLIHAKQTMEKRNLSREIDDKMRNVTYRPMINQKSRSMQRTIDDLFMWQQQKNNKLEAKRNLSASPQQNSLSTQSKSNTNYGKMPVEDRLLMHGLRTQQKKQLRIQEQEEESERELQRLTYTYPSKVAAVHTHYVDIEETS
jgi:hypothetical protein